jgi:hypothetical protein
MPSTISRSLGGWNCPIHGGFSNLNRCAWPDCPNGVVESSVNANIPGLDKVDTFHRLSWDGLSGDTFYDWQTGNSPSSLGISRPYSYFQNKLIKRVPLDQMSHYTSAEGALAILQSGSLRFTDYAYLNDTREVTYGLDIARSVLNTDAFIAGSQVLTKLKAHIEDGDPFSPYNIYTASFSSDPDSLSQFRLYGPVALGFEANSIGFGYPKGELHLGHVVYDSDQQAQLIETFFDLVKQSEKKDAAGIKRDGMRQITTEFLVNYLLRILALFKHPTFSDEREVRLLYAEPLEIMDQFEEETAHRQFRISDGLIIPFTDTSSTTRIFRSDKPTQTPQNLPLKSVAIGPTTQAEALARGMRDLLSSEGYHDVEVSLSEAPLRS